MADQWFDHRCDEKVSFLTVYGLTAAVEGGALQLALICLKGFAALLFYIAFNGIEHEMVYRCLTHH